MNWLQKKGLVEKPIVVIEDHTYHIQEILDRLDESDSPLLSQMTVVSLDRPGSDTTRSALSWLDRFPELQVVSTMDATVEQEKETRVLRLESDLFQNHHGFCKAIARLLRPDGLLVQDIQLDTLEFLSREEWWSSIYLASTIRGMFSQRAPSARFMSNKSGFGIGFGRDLMEAGFDPREVIDKSQLTRLIVPVLDDYMESVFPLELELCRGHEEPVSHYINRDDRTLIDAQLDLVWWGDRHAGPELSGRLISKPLKPKSQEQTTWEALISDYFDAGTGVAVDNVGARLTDPEALKAERTNAAARHIHGLRSRLTRSSALLTEQSAYHLDRELVVGRVSRAV